MLELLILEEASKVPDNSLVVFAGYNIHNGYQLFPSPAKSTRGQVLILHRSNVGKCFLVMVVVLKR